jgi:hypothetical protein
MVVVHHLQCLHHLSLNLHNLRQVQGRHHLQQVQGRHHLQQVQEMCHLRLLHVLHHQLPDLNLRGRVPKLRHLELSKLDHLEHQLVQKEGGREMHLQRLAIPISHVVAMTKFLLFMCF